MKINLQPTSFLTLADYTAAEIEALLDLSAHLKAAKKKRHRNATPQRQKHRADF